MEKLDKIWNGYGEDKVGKGSAFERLMASYLRTAPEYADRFDEVYLWQEWPERGNQHDHGIDIVARDVHNGGWCAIQCKFYDPQHHVSKKDIDSFLAASAKSQYTSRMMFSTAKDWGPTAEKQLDGLTVPVTRIGVSDLLESKVDWSQIDWQDPQQYLPTTGKHELRPHQKKAKQAVMDGLLEHDRGQLIMACGTGKTFTSLKIAEQFATDHKNKTTTVLFLVPSIQLLNQTLREWKQETEIPFRAFAVCSDTRVGKRSDSEDISVTDLIHPATTDTQALAEQIREQHEDENFTVVFSTYQSIDVVAEAQKDGLPEFDLIVADEAHRTTGVTLADDEDGSAFVRVHDNSRIKGAKRLYMTATPRLFNPETKEKADNADAVLASMDDESVYGPVFHRLGFGQAVEQDLLTDYKVLVLKVDRGTIAESFHQELAASSDIKLDDATKLVGCWNGLAKRFDTKDPDSQPLTRAAMKTAVAFAGNIKSSKAVEQAFPQIVDRLISTYEDDTDAQHPNNLQVDIRHVDGTMNALERGGDLQWLKAGSNSGDNTCRLLTNVKCLSEGVDVPSLDAVIFLSPRASQVDIVQSVGRVMRKDPTGRKKTGYIILPVVVDGDTPPEAALADNKAFQTVWEVLQALRAHDDRFNAMVNQLDLNKAKDTHVIFDDATPGKADSDKEDTQLTLPFGIEAWRDAIYARIVKKVGERRYWETWAKDIAEIAQTHIVRINGLLADQDSPAAQEFEAFLEGLRGNLNDGITRDDAVEMLAQHLITRPVFEALFAGYDFAQSNPVAQTMERMLTVLDEHALDDENESLTQFYDSVRARVDGVDNAEGRQRIIVELYDKFFATAFKKTVDKLGIVYTPVEIVDFILRSADDLLRQHFGQGLTDEAVHVLDGFTGTGTFMTRLLQSHLIEPHDLARKYANELHANEILLLAYYIAAVNIETTYQDLRHGSLDAGKAQYEPFEGLVLTDTFQSYEHGDEDDLGVFPENNERINRQRKLPITVIVGNPPYSSGQDSANDDNANEKYPTLDAAIRETYAAASTARSTWKLYDSYIRAIKWATLRIQNRGIIAYVTNGGFLDANSADGLRKSLAEEFSEVHVLNLRGNQRTAGEQSRKEGGKVFGAGSRATVAITVLVKDPSHTGPATIHYTDIGDYLSREDKLRMVGDARSIVEQTSVTIEANEHGDWLSQRRDDFGSFMPAVGDEPARIGAFQSRGLTTGRDWWVYGSSRGGVQSTVQTTLATFNEVVDGAPRTNDKGRIAWSGGLQTVAGRGRHLSFDPNLIREATYRPFFRQFVYFSPELIERPARLSALLPTPDASNSVISMSAPGAGAPFTSLLVSGLPDIVIPGAGNPSHFLPRWRYEPVDEAGSLFGSGVDDLVDGYRRIDNITDEALGRFRAAYGQSFTKDDIFFYVYGLLHSPDYRETYAADLKKSLPRIPLVVDAAPFVEAGRRLSELHLGYEAVAPYPLDGLETDPGNADPYEYFRVEKMKFAKVRDPESKKLVADKTTVVYNDRITLSGIPEEAYRYMLGSRSAIEWIIDRYRVKTDKPSGIVNDPNDWSKEVEDPRYIVDLLARIVTVSLETMAIVDSLPALDILQEQ
nr:type ISP restriction/modification enzyme [Janibacter cremeus]